MFGGGGNCCAWASIVFQSNCTTVYMYMHVLDSLGWWTSLLYSCIIYISKPYTCILIKVHIRIPTMNNNVIQLLLFQQCVKLLIGIIDQTNSVHCLTKTGTLYIHDFIHNTLISKYLLSVWRIRSLCVLHE